MVLAYCPVVMAVGTCALMLAEHTPVFNWLGAPFVPLLGCCNCRRRKPSRPSWWVSPICSSRRCWPPTIERHHPLRDRRRIPVTQLIYMSEVGALLLGGSVKL